MLSWITGFRASANCTATHDMKDGVCDDAEQPDTPAPVFAVRAFKQAIFGSGKSWDEQYTEEPSRVPAVPSSNFLTTPIRNKSNTSSLNGRKDGSNKPGILMTPRTVNARKKSVSFGELVKDNEGKTTEMCPATPLMKVPGKFPGSASATKTYNLRRTRSNLGPGSGPNEDWDDVLRQPNGTGRTVSQDDLNITMDLTSPESESGKFWKAQYEMYSTRSDQEIRLLLSKLQQTKDFIRKRDEKSVKLSGQLKAERERNKAREKELLDLVAKLQADLQNHNPTLKNQHSKDEIGKPNDEDELLDIGTPTTPTRRSRRGNRESPVRTSPRKHIPPDREAAATKRVLARRSAKSRQE